MPNVKNGGRNIGLRAGVWLVVLALLSGGACAQDAKTAFEPVPEEQRARLDERLKEVTAAYRQKDWAELFELVSDANRKHSDGKPVDKATFAYEMGGGFNAYRLLKFEPAHTVNAWGANYDVYGCGEFPIGTLKPERIVVAVRVVREHDDWFYTTWDYPDPRLECSTLEDPEWKPSPSLRMEFLPQLVCIIHICTL